jgi:MYXO-CTERM domain-containing protein
VDTAGNTYIADTDNYTIRKVTGAGVVTTLAGRAGTSGSADGTGTAATFFSPSGIAIDSSGTLFVADSLNHTIRKVAPAGAVTTIAGTAGAFGTLDGTGAAARFHGPQGLVVDGSGNLYVADTNNSTIRKIVTATGAVTTLTGQAGISGSTDGSSSQARFYYPSGLALDGAGDLLVADTDNHSLRQISSPGAVSTIAGVAGLSGSTDGTGTAVRFNYPTGIAADGSANVYVADTNNHTIRVGGFPTAPIITAQPSSQTVTAGANVQFSVTATGRPAPTYQWNFNGTAISGATSATLSLSNVQSSSTGTYTVGVTNSSGTVTSNQAMLTVNAASASPSGGGGASETWFVTLLALLGAARHRVRRS